MTVRFICGDCLDVLPTLAAESVHCCVTSPPYWGLRDYGIEGQFGLESTPAEWVGRMVEVFREVRRVLRSDGTLWLNVGDSYSAGTNDDKSNRRDRAKVNPLNRKHQGASTLQGSKETQVNSLRVSDGKLRSGLPPKNLMGMPWRLAFALQDDGWILRKDIIWHKPNPMPESAKDRPTSSHEYLFLMSKPGRYYYDGEAISETFQTNPIENYPERAKVVGRGQEAYNENGRIGDRDKSGGFPAELRRRNKRDVWTIPTYAFRGEFCISCKRFYGKGTDHLPVHLHADSDGGGYVGKRCRRARRPRSEPGRKEKARVPTGWDTGTGTHDEKTGRYEEMKKHAICVCGKWDSWLSHFATFPPDLVEPCILAGCPLGGTMLDPFGGAATVALVTQIFGPRDCVSIELNSDYDLMGQARVAEGVDMLTDIEPVAKFFEAKP